MDAAQLSTITDVQQLHALVIAQAAAIDERDTRLAQRDRTIVWKQAKIDKLTAEIRRLQRLQFSARSEKMDPEQRALFDESMAADIAALEDELAEAQHGDGETPAVRPARTAPKRRPLPPELPRIETRHEPESCDCGTCGAALVPIGEHVSEKLDCEPLKFFVRRDIYPQYACRACETITAEAVAPSVLDRGIAAPGLLAQVVIAKYVDHCVPRTHRLGRRCGAVGEMRVWPLASGDQVLGANRCKLLSLRAMVVSVADGAGEHPASVRSGETSASKPPMNCRNRIVDVKTGIGGPSGINAGGVLKPGPRGIRLEGGVNPDQALARNVGTCRHDAKGTIQVGQPGEERSTDAWHRDRAARSSVDDAVMVSERRGSGIQPWHVANQ